MDSVPFPGPAAPERRRVFDLGNLFWRGDSSSGTVPAQCSVLHASVIPPEDGGAEFADMPAALRG